MKFKAEPASIGYFLYVEIDGKWEFIDLTLTFIGAKFSAWRYKRRCRKAIEFEM